MSKIAMWLGGRAAGRWLPALALAAAAATSLALGQLVGHGLATSGEPTRATIGLTAAPTTTLAATSSPSPDASSTAAAAEVARAFLVAYASYRFDDSSDSLRRRLRAYDTDRFDTSLALGGDPGLPTRAAADRHEVATAAVQQVSATIQAPDGRLVVVALVSQNVRSDQGTRTSARYVELFLARTAGGWRVDEVAA